MYITVCTLQELHRGILGAAVLIDNKQHAYAYRNWMHEWLHVLVVMCVNRTGLCVCKAACAGVYVRQPHRDVCLQGCMCWCVCASTAQGCVFARLHVLVCMCVNRTGMCVCKAACAGVYVRQPHRVVCLQGCMCWCVCASTAQGCVLVLAWAPIDGKMSQQVPTHSLFWRLTPIILVSFKGFGDPPVRARPYSDGKLISRC